VGRDVRTTQAQRETGVIKTSAHEHGLGVRYMW